MEKNINYKIARNLSLGYAIFATISLFFNIELIGNLLFLVVFPYLLMTLKRLIMIEYDFISVNMYFNITVCVTIISTIVPYIGSAILMTIVDLSTLSGTMVGDKVFIPANLPHKDLIINFARIMEILLVFRGISFLAVSGVLTRKFNEFCINLKVVAISLIFSGICAIIIGIIGLFPTILHVFTHELVMLYINILKILMAITLILMFGSMVLVFRQEYNVKRDVT